MEAGGGGATLSQNVRARAAHKKKKLATISEKRFNLYEMQENEIGLCRYLEFADYPG